MFYDDDDDFDDFYFGDYDDPVYLPNHFITCFNIESLPLYEAAIAELTKIKPNHGLDIDTSGSWNSMHDPALLCYERGDLTEFWRIFEKLSV